MTDASINQILTTILVNLPGLILATIAAFKAHRADKSSHANTSEIQGIMAAVVDIKTHINSKMDLLLKTVAEKSLLEGSMNERARRDAKDDSDARAVGLSKALDLETKLTEVKINVAKVDVSKIIDE